MLQYERIVELSRVLVAGEEEYGLEYKLSNVEDVLPQYKRQEGDWYVLGEIRMSTHVGTHIEFPFHHVRDGKDAASYPVGRLIGEAVVLDFSHKKKNEEIT
ncbi:MAG: cyclase family protein, partial [Acidobacteria bacterium]|nr:cyclase family protein [Acidobacteriota bacterium]